MEHLARFLKASSVVAQAIEEDFCSVFLRGNDTQPPASSFMLPLKSSALF